MTYQLNVDGWPTRLPDGAFVDPNGVEYRAWIAAGNTPLPPDPALVAAAQAQSAFSAQLAQDTADTKAVAAVKALLMKTPAQVDAYLDANVVDLASARAVIKIVVKVLAIVARQTFS